MSSSAIARRRCRSNRAALSVALLAVAVPAAYGAQVRGYTGQPPIVPSKKLPDLVVEQVWKFDDGIVDENMGVTYLDWIPGTEKVIVARKKGYLHMYDTIDADVDEYKEVFDMNVDVASLDDHGLLGFAFHPNFGKPGVGTNSVFILYTGQPKDVTLLPNDAAVAQLRPAGWGEGPPGTKGYAWDENGYLCPALEEPLNNYGGKLCEKVYYIDRVLFDVAAGTMVKDITLFTGVCGASSTHGTGVIQQIPGGFAFAMGDGSLYDAVPAAFLEPVWVPWANIDPGFPVDGCFDPAKGADQGQFRAQRMDFPNGKVMLLPTELMDSKVPIQYEDLLVISRGSRQPFRMYYHDKSDTLFLADVGQGDGPTTERIFLGEGISKRLTPAMSKTPFNWGWPCVEGVYGSVEAKYEAPDVYAVYDSDSEQTRAAYLAQNNLDTCAPVYAAVQEYTGIAPPVAGAMPAGTVADAQWRAPIFEYRDGVIDPEFPEYCQNDGTASITAMHVSDSKALPLELQGKLFFGDHVKGCVWYFDADADGAPDATKPPHVLMTRTNAVDIRTGPDGALYIIDYDNTRITRAFARGKGPGALNEGPTDPPTTAPTPAPFAVPEVVDALQCFDGAGMPELQWTRNEDGTYGGDLIFDAVNLNTPNGVVRTRAFNYMVSAPVIRMKACNTYKLNVNNNLVDWPVGIQQAVPNTVHDPTVMNIHLHGLHISGEAPSDDVLTVVAPGDTVEYTYAVPCDHAGGHHWYHPHHHGSTALQVGGGAAGLLIIEPGPREASTIPAAFSTMPEQHMIIYDFDLKTLANVADGSGDPIFAAPDGGAAQTFAMVNGCGKVPTFQIEAGQWTKLRILNVGATYNVALTLMPPAAGILPCDVMLIAKDGVPVNDAPRAVAKNMMFMSLASRLEVAVRCPVATLPAAPHLFTYQHFGAAGLEKPPTIATVTVVASYRDAAPDLPPLAPCRAVYLTSSAAVPLLQRDAPFQIAMRGDGINSEKYTGEAEDFHTFILDKPQRWTVAGSFQHPVHVHVNHMEIAAVTPDNDIDGIPGWNVVGDWIDTLAVPNGVDVFVRAERFTGKMMIHCHIAQHSDLGVTKVMNIVPDPAAIAPLAAAPIAVGGPADIQVADWGTCPALIPASTPFNVGAPAAVPGVIQAEEFDLGGEGIAYHNINLDRGAPPAIRAGEASVEIDTIAVGKAQVTAVGYIRDGEWLKYSVNIAAAGFYTASLTVAAAPAPLLTPLGMHWSLWLDVDGGCPAPGTPGKLLTVADDKWNGTGGALVFAAYDAPGFMRILVPGAHTITLCFEGNAGFELDSLTIAAWKPAP